MSIRLYIRQRQVLLWLTRRVKRLLRKYGYPPDLQDATLQNALQQAEALSAQWMAQKLPPGYDH